MILIFFAKPLFAFESKTISSARSNQPLSGFEQDDMEAPSKFIVSSRLPPSLSKLKTRFLSCENAMPLFRAIELLSLFRYPSSDLK